MKAFKLFIAVVLAGSFTFFVTQCSDDDESGPTLFSISGTVTYPDFNGNSTAAAGAVAYLAQSSTQTMSYQWSAVTNSTGGYTFEGLPAGDYFLFVNYNTENDNIPEARIDGINFTSGAGFLLTIADADLTQAVALESSGQTETFSIDTESGPGEFDFSHSNIDVEFPYDNENATYTGRFDNFDLDIVFDQSNPAAATLTASVDMLSFNTSSPGGRDSYEASTDVWEFGCLAGTFGVSDDQGNNPPVDGNDADETTRYATFTSTSVEAYGDGYLAKGNFTVNGSTNEESFFFKYIVGYQGQNFLGQDFLFQSVEGFLVFNAEADYGMSSSHLLTAPVTVKISMQLETPLN